MRQKLVAFLCRVILVLACIAAAVAGFGMAWVLPAAGTVLFAAFVWEKARPKHNPGTAHGTARPSSFMDLARYGFLGEDGLILGRAGWAQPPNIGQALAGLFSPAVSSRIACGMLFGRRWCSEQVIRLKSYTHLATFSPTGGGKGVSVAIPNLLNLRRSVVVTDPKGELYNLTAEFRRRNFRNRIVRLDPFGACGAGGDALNPLDTIDEKAPDFLDQVRSLANALVLRSGRESEPHWDDSAENVLTAFIAFVAACETDRSKRNLHIVRSLISARSAYSTSVATMQRTQGFGGVVQRLGHSLSWLAERELSSVLSVVQRHTAWMDSPAVSACMTRSTFDPLELRGGRLSVYLILPPDRLVTLAPLMRMWLGTILRTLTRGAASEKSPVLFMIDEAAHLGKMQILEEALTLMRGYGIRIWLFFQSLGQLQKCYGDQAQTVLENIHTQQYFGTNSFQSADELSKRIGDATILIQSLNRSASRSWPTGRSMNGPQPGNASESISVTTSQHVRRWLKPEELLMQPGELALVFHKNLPVIPARLIRYYDAPEFRRGRDGRNVGIAKKGCFLAFAILFAGAGLFAIRVQQPSGLPANARIVPPLELRQPADHRRGLFRPSRRDESRPRATDDPFLRDTPDGLLKPPLSDRYGRMIPPR